MRPEAKEQLELKPYLEKKEKTFAGKTILVTGAGSGTGEMIAAELYGQGANVIIGTRSEENFQKIQRIFGSKSRLFPFFADLSNEEQIKRYVNDLKLNILKQIIPQPTIVIHSAAGGMENAWGHDKVEGFRRYLSEKDSARKQELFESLKENIKENTEKSLQASEKTNFEGSKVFIEEISEIMPVGSRIITYPSIWSYLQGESLGHVPEFYRATAISKSHFEKWLEANAGEFKRKGISISFIVGYLIRDSKAGRILEFILRAAPEAKEKMEESSISKNDMVNATINVLKSDPKDWEQFPLKKFVTNKGVLDELPSNDPIFDLELPI